MKGSTLLLLCAVALAQSVELKLTKNGEKCNCNPGEAWQICDANWDKDDVLVAHPYCDKFYKCANGRPVTYDCAPGLLYNPYTEECDWPQNVDCGDRPISDGQSVDEEDCDEDDNDSDSVDKSEEDGDDNGQVDGDNGGGGDNGGDGEDCDDNGTDNGGTDNGGSDNGESDTGNVGGGHCDPSEAPAICAAEDSEDVLVAHENCNKYYICNGGRPVAMSCPDNLLFNPFTDQCDWPEKVDCGDRIIPDPEDNDSGDNGGSDNGGSDNGGSDNGGSDNGDSDNDGSDNNGSDNGGSDNGGGGTCNCNPGEAQEICAADGSDGVFVAHDNCNQYYKCDHGTPTVFTCFGTLLYNPYTEKCDWPENVECGDRIIPDPEDDSNGGSDNGGSDNGGSDNGGSNSGESDSEGSDNDGSDNGESDNGPVGGGNCDPSEAPTVCAADDSEGVLVAHENCNQFYICNGGKPVAMTCPNNLLFNPNTDQCDWPDNVDCGDRVIPDPEDNDNGGSDNGGSDNGDSDNGGSDNGGSDNGGSDNGGSDNGGSDNGGSDNGGSDNGDNSGTCNCNPGEAPEICAADGSDGALIAHENCNQFYMCAHGKPVAVRCYGTLLFNPYTEKCDWPENVECGDRIIPDPEDDDSGNSDNGGSDNEGSDNGGSDNGGSDNGPVGGGNCDPSEAPAICAADDSEGVLVAHENCNQFYICNGGMPVVLTCPNNLLFNPNTDQCDWPDNVDCGDRVIPDPEDNDNGGSDNGGSDNGGSDNGGSDNGGSDNGGSDNGGSDNGGSDNGDNGGTCNCNPGEAPEICAADGSDGTLIAHENCNQFYMCAHGKPVAFRCYGTLLYNPYTEQCDWPENVECGDRIIPDPEDDDSGDSDNGGSENEGSDNGGSDNGGSDNGPVGGGNCDPSEAPAICAADDSEGVLVAHENCNQFYICNGGMPVVLTCPNNLLFNPNTDQCDWPDNVDCGDRVIPDPEDNDNGGSDNGGSDNGGSDNGGSDNGSSDNGGSDNGGSDNGGSDNGGSDNGGSDNGGSDNGGSDNGGSENGGSDNGGSDNGGSNSGESDNEGSDNSESDNGPVGGGNCDPSEAPTICAADNSEGVLVAHENCNQFYICNGGKPVALTCPNNLLFNPNTDQCDWPENVDCGDRVIPDPEDNDNGGSDNGGSDNGDSDNGGSDNGGSDNGGSDNGGSDNGGSDNGGSDNDGSDNGGSDNGGSDNGESDNGSGGTCNCNPGEAPEICAADESEGVLIAHEKCDQFYKCANGVPVALNCYGGLLYNPYTGQCDWPQNVECGDRVIPDPEDNDNGSEDNGGTDNDGSDSDGSDNGGSDNGSGGTCNCNPGEAPEICAADESEGVLIAHENCDQFYKCANGVPVALNCYGGLLYNPYTEQCDWAQNIECGDRVIPDAEDNDNGSGDNGGSDNGGSDNDGSDNGGSDNDGSDNDGSDNDGSDNDGSDNDGSDNEGSDNDGSDNDGSDNDGSDNGGSDNGDNESGIDDPSQAPSICAGSGSDGTLVAHENCNQYYTCSGGLPVTMSCAGDLLFNVNTQQCDWPRLVDCGDRIVPDVDDCFCNPRQAPAICVGDNTDGIMIAHDSCDQFFVCAGGVPVARSCPAGLNYNPRKEVCDWPMNVDCDTRVSRFNSLNKHLESRQVLRK